MAWTQVEKAAKNDKGEYMALVNGSWQPAEKAAKNDQGQYMAVLSSQQPSQIQPSPTGIFPQAVSGVAEGVADIAGMPVDTANAMANLAVAGYGMGRQLVGQAMGESPSEAASHAPDTTPASTIPGSSEWIKQKLMQTGMTSQAPQTTGEKVARGVGEFAGAAAVPVPTPKTSTLTNIPVAEKTASNLVQEMHKAGYILPPTQARPSILNRLLEGLSGKLQTAQQASGKNQAVTNSLVRKALGLSEDAPLTSATLSTVREQAGKAYGVVSNLTTPIQADEQYLKAISKLGGDFEAASKEFPDLIKTPEIDALTESLSKSSFSPKAAIEVVKKLRYEASKNIKNAIDPSKRALGYAQRKAAGEVDDLVERNLTANGQKDLATRYHQSREIIAKAHDVETALEETTQNVSARALGNLLKKGRPLSGELRTVGRMARTFPKATQDVEKIGSMPGLSPLDYGASLISFAAWHHPVAASMLVARPALRSLLLSKPYQEMAAGIPSYRLAEALQSHPGLPIALQHVVTNE